MKPRYFFFRDDLKALDEEIERLKDRIRAAGKEMGQSCQEGAETYHDNFAYEEGSRQQGMWSQRIRHLVNIRNHAQVVSPPSIPNSRASMGKTVSIEDMDSGDTRIFRIGSFMTFPSPDQSVQTLSYATPLARIVIGHEEGDVCEGEIGGKPRAFRILDLN